MTALPPPGYISDPNINVQEQKDALEAVRNVVSELPGGDAITTLTIDSGTVTPDRGTHRIDTEGQVATDTLERIGFGAIPDGRLLTIIQADPARQVTVRHLATGDGEIQLSAGRDIILGKRHCLFLQRILSRWVQTFETRFGPAPGVVEQFAGSTPPTGAVFCYGQLLNVADEPELFDVLGTTYGGDGVDTFGLPDLRDRVAIGKGDMGGTPAGRMPTTGAGSPGIDTSQLNAAGGVDRHTLLESESPNHDHDYGQTSHDHGFEGLGSNIQDMGRRTGAATIAEGTGTPQARLNTLFDLDIAPTTANITFNAKGGDQAHQNVQPGVVLNYIIWT